MSIYNVAEPETMNAQMWVERVAAAAGIVPDTLSGELHASGIAAREYFPFRDYPCALDVTSFLQDLDWTFQFNFDDGIRRTFQSYNPEALKQLSPSSDEEQRILASR